MHGCTDEPRAHAMKDVRGAEDILYLFFGPSEDSQLKGIPTCWPATSRTPSYRSTPTPTTDSCSSTRTNSRPRSTNFSPNRNTDDGTEVIGYQKGLCHETHSIETRYETVIQDEVLGGVHHVEWPAWYAEHMARTLTEDGYQLVRTGVTARN